MSKAFVIAGLPRSRTAWCAAFFSNYPAMCYHDRIGTLENINDLKYLFRNPYYTHIGISDTVAGFFMPWVMEHLNAKVMVIDRDIEAVELSLMQLNMPTGKYLDYMREQMRQYKNHPDVLWMPFEALSDKRAMQKAWFHLLPGMPFDEERYEMFNRMNIQVTSGAIETISFEVKPKLEKLMRDVIQKIREYQPCSQN